ncbi:MAG: SMP-30/gluconolactonase/LRE family protein, partial [Rubripirellula sp.]
MSCGKQHSVFQTVFPSLAVAAGIFVGAATLGVARAQESSEPPQNLNQIEPVGVVETVHSGFAFTEGPAWDPNGTLYFTDIPNTTIHTLSSDGKLGVFTKDSKHSNGLLIVADGRMLACQMDGR